jgi:5-hydroxyisourate hydrolase-like protein (transthyretin family)
MVSARAGLGVVAAAAVLLLAIAERTEACSCITGAPICETFWKTPVVFSGEVVDISDAPEPIGDVLFGRRVVKFRVEKSWRGDVAGELEVRTGTGGGDCGYNFERGVKYLVYANVRDGRLSTGICNRTKPLAEAGEDLAYLATAFERSVTGRIFGRVTFHRATPDDPVTPLSGYAVTLSADNKTWKTTTDRDGRYEFKDVLTGRYEVQVATAPTERARGNNKVELVDPRGCAAADFWVAFDGRIAARLVNANGQPAVGYRLEVISLEALEANRIPRSWPAPTGADGRAEIAELAPDRYLLAIGLTQGASAQQPHGTLYFPGVRDPAAAQVIDLGPGERIDLGDFVLTPPLRTERITGVVQWADGSPAADIDVNLQNVRGGRALHNSHAKTDAQGRFDLPAFLGEEYKITAFFNSLRDRTQWIVEVPEFHLTAETAHHKLTLQPVRPR